MRIRNYLIIVVCILLSNLINYTTFHRFLEITGHQLAVLYIVGIWHWSEK